MPHSATINHLTTQRAELDRRYDMLTKHIRALDTSIGRELDLERKLVFQERRADLAQERNQIVAELRQLERKLSVTLFEPEGLVLLEGRADAQQREGRISATERDALEAIYRSALSRTETSEALANEDPCVDPVDIDEGETMTAQNTHIVNLAESVFTRTSYSLTQDLAKVVEYQKEWPDLIIGDPVTDRSIQALNDMQKRMTLVGRIAAEHVAPSARRRFQMERDGLLNSANQLVGYLEESSGHLVHDRMPWYIIEQMQQQLDELTYYTNRCLLWLDDLAQSNRQTETLQ